jgi:hypothetical protein
MAIGIISDIHANIEALDAVAADIEQMDKEYGIAEVHCLGDIVNYGPNPAECVRRVRALCDIVLRGNHDDAVATLNRRMLRKNFHDEQRAGVFWTRKQLDNDALDYLAALPHQHLQNGFAEVHGTFCTRPLSTDDDYAGDPVKNLEYATFTRYSSVRKETDIQNLMRCFQSMEERNVKTCFVGHVQAAEGFAQYFGPAPTYPAGHPENQRPASVRKISLDAREHEGPVSVIVELQDNWRYIFDVGSVGQPRDLDNRASYGIYTGTHFINRRVPYDFEKTAGKIKEVASYREKHSLSPWFGERLALGK